MNVNQITWQNLATITIPRSGTDLLSSTSLVWLFNCSSTSAKSDWKQAGWILPIYQVGSIFTLGKTQELKLGRNLIYIPFQPFTMRLLPRVWIDDLVIEVWEGSI